MHANGLVSTLRRGAMGASKAALYATEGRCRFDRTIFMLAHMRCGSTALSNVICAHPEICGYGETHVVYADEADVGLLAAKSLYNRAWKPGFRFFYDKVLWNHLDAPAGPAFFRARAIFSCRNPRDTIASILNLAARNAYMRRFDAEAAAEYYETRMERLLDLWDGFPAERRIGISYERMTASTEAVLAGISRMIGLGRPLANSYSRQLPKGKVGVGDPLEAGRHNRIVAKESEGRMFRDVVDRLPASRMRRMESLYADFRNRTAPAAARPLAEPVA